MSYLRARTLHFLCLCRCVMCVALLTINLACLYHIPLYCRQQLAVVVTTPFMPFLLSLLIFHCRCLKKSTADNLLLQPDSKMKVLNWLLGGKCFTQEGIAGVQVSSVVLSNNSVLHGWCVCPHFTNLKFLNILQSTALWLMYFTCVLFLIAALYVCMCTVPCFSAWLVHCLENCLFLFAVFMASCCLLYVNFNHHLICLKTSRQKSTAEN